MPPTHSAQSITPRCAAGMISPPGMLTVFMPMRWNTSALMPVWRHFMPLKSARFLIGRLNQPKACGLVGMRRERHQVELHLLLIELDPQVVSAALPHPPEVIGVVHAEGASGGPANSTAARFLFTQ